MRRRTLLLSPLSLLPLRGAATSWLTSRPRVFLLDFQLPDPLDQGVEIGTHFLAACDPLLIVSQVKRAGATALIVHTKCHEGNAYYPTRIGHQHSDLKGRDLVAEFCLAARTQSITPLFYHSMGWDHRAFDSHPDWRALLADRTPVFLRKDSPGLPSRDERYQVCMNGGYREYLKSMLRELVDGYDFDGFWLDVHDRPPCFCEFCCNLYHSQTGSRVPSPGASPDDLRRYQVWRRSLHVSVMTDILASVRSRNPKLTLAVNMMPGRPVTELEAADPQDYLSHEYHYPEGPAGVSLISRKLWSVKPGVPFEIESWRFANRLAGPRASLRGFQVREAQSLLLEMAGIVSHGGFPQYYDQIRSDGTLDPRSLASLQPAFVATARRQPWSAIGDPLPYASIVWSRTSEAFASSDARALHEEGVEGIHNALVERHVPVSLLTERDLAAGKLRGARVLIVPSAQCLSSDAVTGLERFADAGGGVLITGLTANLDSIGRAHSRWPLEGLTGLRLRGKSEFQYTFFQRSATHPVCDRLLRDFPICVYDTHQADVESVRPGDTLAVRVDPLIGFRMGAMPSRPSILPALFSPRRLKGRVLFASFELGAVYHRHHLEDLRKLIVDATLWAAAVPPVLTSSAPETLEVVPWISDAGRRLVVHLINRTGAGPNQGEGALLRDVIPLHDVELRFHPSVAIRRAVLQPAGRPLTPSSHSQRPSLRIPRIDTWEIVDLQLSRSSRGAQ